jgi:hypothetical protein
MRLIECEDGTLVSAEAVTVVKVVTDPAGEDGADQTLRAATGAGTTTLIAGLSTPWAEVLQRALSLFLRWGKPHSLSLALVAARLREWDYADPEVFPDVTPESVLGWGIPPERRALMEEDELETPRPHRDQALLDANREAVERRVLAAMIAGAEPAEAREKAEEAREKAEEAAYDQGYRDALRTYAWWKGGVQYVGAGFYTLERALAECHDDWNYRPPEAAGKGEGEHVEQG